MSVCCTSEMYGIERPPVTPTTPTVPPGSSPCARATVERGEASASWQRDDAVTFAYGRFSRVRSCYEAGVRRLAAVIVLGFGCTRSPGDDGGFSAGAVGNDDDGTTRANDEDSEDSGLDDTTGAPPSGEPCQDHVDCADDPAGPVCDALLGVCGAGCVPGETRACYTGPAGTEDVGACRIGENRCSDTGAWEPWCDGEVLPSVELCDNGIDDDCDGTIDDSDHDGDGWGVCSGDCCDADGSACTNAALVNPGAYEVPGNGVDDNCNGEIDEVEPTCDETLVATSSSALDFARALDLCHFTEEAPRDPLERTWGVISAKLSRANGNGLPLAVQRRLAAQFGNIVAPPRGERMVVLSSGHAVDANDPAFTPFQPGANLGTSSTAPADWLAANGGTFPNPGGCLSPWNTNANDPIMLTLRMRAPTNAASFSVKMFFVSAEYPEWVCSEFNDFFVALVDSTADNPADKNIAIYDDGNERWPVGVNLAMVADGLFTQCENGEIGCARDLSAQYTDCLGIAQLSGTGFDEPGNACSANQSIVGGGTGWLDMSGNVTPGEIFEIRFAIWDTSGHIYDSLVLLDDWRWSLQAASPGVAPG